MRPARMLIAAGVAALLVLPASASAAGPVLRIGNGNAAAIQTAVNQFQTDLGTLNPNNGTNPPTGRREINWDGVPNASAAPNPFPASFFNVTSPRGVVLSTPGAGFQVSANSGVAPVNFGNIDPSYSGTFTTFSAQRLFTPIGSTFTTVSFFVPGTTTPATVSGFGAVFADIDTFDDAGMTFFDVNGNVINAFSPGPGSNALSFYGASYPGGERIASVLIRTGTAPLAGGTPDGGQDLVVLDDFIYGEPQAVQPSTGGGGGGGDSGGGSTSTTATSTPTTTTPVVAPALPDTTAPSLAALAAKKVKAGRSSQVRFTLSEDANVEIVVAKAVAAKRKAHRSAKKAKPKLKTVATLRVAGHTGANVVGLRRLGAGSYTLSATATDAAGNRSAARTAKLKIAKRAR